MAAESTTETRKQMLRALTRQGEALEALIASGSLDIAAESLSMFEQGSRRYLAALRACVMRPQPSSPAAPAAPAPAAPAAAVAPTPAPAATPVPVSTPTPVVGPPAAGDDDPFAGRL